MLNIRIEKIGNMAVVECSGRIVRSDAAFQLRDAVMAQRAFDVIVLDLSDVTAVEGGGLGMLHFLQRWTEDNHIQLKLFNPNGPVKRRLQLTDPPPHLEIASMGEMIALLAQADQQFAIAA